MAPIAAGFMVLVAAAAFLGVMVGAIGGAVAWRVRINLALGLCLTAAALLVVLVATQYGEYSWLRAKLAWGAPPLILSYLMVAGSADWLESRTKLPATWTAFVAFCIGLVLGLVYLRLLGISRQAPRLAVPAVALFLLYLLIRPRWRSR
jgi:hypothetical protein